MSETKVCCDCKLKLPLSRFGKKKDGVQPYCKKCISIRNKKVLEDPVKRQRFIEAVKRSVRKMMDEVIEGYGGKCVCCGETERGFLTIDHIFNDGNTERKTTTTATFYRKLRKEGFPRDRYQCLCYNCNCAKGALGQCPHEKKRQEALAAKA